MRGRHVLTFNRLYPTICAPRPVSHISPLKLPICLLYFVFLYHWRWLARNSISWCLVALFFENYYLTMHSFSFVSLHAHSFPYCCSLPLEERPRFPPIAFCFRSVMSKVDIRKTVRSWRYYGRRISGFPLMVTGHVHKGIDNEQFRSRVVFCSRLRCSLITGTT